MIGFSTLALAVVAQVPATPLPAPATPLPIVSPGVPATPPTAAPLPAATPVPAGTAPAPGIPPAVTPVPAAQPQTAPATPSPYTYRFVPKQADHPAPGAPQIYAVYLNSKTLHSLGPILIKVATDPGTVKVTSRSNGREGIIPMIAPGDFEAVGKLPKVPFIADGMTVQLEFVALGQNGQHVSVRVPVELK